MSQEDVKLRGKFR